MVKWIISSLKSIGKFSVYTDNLIFTLFLSEKWGFWLGLILSSVIFGLLHPGYAISASIMGAVFVGLYRLTRSLIVPILLHIVWNAFAVVGLIMYVSGL